MMRIFYIFFLLIIKVHGDNNITYPKFPKQAQFFLESIINDDQHQRTLFECIYDYNNNRIILINEQYFEYYNYTILQKFIYSKNYFKQCTTYSIDINNPFDGFSGIRNSLDNTTHIRSLNDFLLLTSNATYLGENILRGFIHVNQWVTKLANDSDIIWSFAKPNYIMPWNSPEYSIPIQRIIKRKDDGVILQILNIFSYKTMIIKMDLTPPKGIFCKDSVLINELRSLQDIGMVFPKKFSVHIDASTTFQQLWQSVHLRYHSTNKRKLIRYDYTPSDNTLNPITIILDSSENTSRLYQIDRHTGSCIINESIEIIPMPSVLHNPIEILIKYEDILLSNPPKHLFQYIGQRPCRGSIMCEIYIGQMSEFPFNLEENWLATNIEWGWSKRDTNNKYDYPVYLNLNFYRKLTEPPFNIHYEFYDYRPDVYLNEFDINLCYRSNQFEYQHLAFQLKFINQTISDNIENNLINRRILIESIRERMIHIMSVKYLRISQLELDHHINESGHNDTLYCIFTLLDRTPFSDIHSEIGLIDAQKKLENGINTGEFQFHTDDGLIIEAIPKSLENIQYFYVFNPNVSINQINYFANTTVHINRTIIEKIEEIYEKIQYSNEAQIGAVLGGIFLGILFGIFIVFVVIYMIKRKANMPSIGGLTFRNISFRMKNNPKQEDQTTVTMEYPIDDSQETFS